MNKRLTNPPLLLTRDFYVILFCNTIMVYGIFAKNPGVWFGALSFFGLNIFLLLITWRKYYQFQYNDTSLVISNSWNPLVAEELEIASIRHITMEYRNGAGFEVMISYKGQVKGFIATAIKTALLREMIDDINNAIRTDNNKHYAR